MPKEFAYQSPTGKIFVVMECDGTTLAETFEPVGKEEFIRLILDHPDVDWLRKELLPKLDSDAKQHVQRIMGGKSSTTKPRKK